MLTTARLLLRPARVADAAMMRELWTERDPRVPPHRRPDADGRPTREDLEQRIRSGGHPGLLTVVELATDEALGYCGLLTTGPDGEPELAFELLRRAHGNGYATEAARAVVDGARTAGHVRLWASVRSWNSASFRVLDKLGFVVTDRVEPDDVHGDSVLTRLDL